MRRPKRRQQVRDHGSPHDHLAVGEVEGRSPPLVRSPGARDRACGALQRRAGLREEHFPGGGEAHTPRQALEQGHAHFPFEVADLLRERGLSDAELPRRLQEAPLFGDGHEVSQVA